MTKEITEEYLKQLEDAAKAATKGPWEYTVYNGSDSPATLFSKDDDGESDIASFEIWDADDYDKEMIANAKHIILNSPDATLALCEYIKQQDADHAEVQSARAMNENILQAEIKRLREVVIEAFEADGEDDTMCVLENEVIDIKKGE